METFTAEKDGFYGRLFPPKTDCCPGRVLILFGGSDGRFELTCMVADAFRKAGVTGLALAYWNAEGLSAKLRGVPVEPLERAALWLKGQGYEKVGVWGISKGGELALLAASLMPELISCVVAVSPMDVVGQGIDARKKRPLPGSSWSWRGRELPYAPLAWSTGRVLLDTLRGRELTMRAAYAGAAARAPAEAVIPVERIGGPVLLLSARHDAIWPSAEASERLMARLEKGGAPYPHRHLCYEYASHFLLPVELRALRAFAIERSAPERCAQSRADAFQKTLDFLREW